MPLHLAVQSGHMSVVQILMRFNAKIDGVNKVSTYNIRT